MYMFRIYVPHIYIYDQDIYLSRSSLKNQSNRFNKQSIRSFIQSTPSGGCYPLIVSSLPTISFRVLYKSINKPRPTHLSSVTHITYLTTNNNNLPFLINKNVHQSAESITTQRVGVIPHVVRPTEHIKNDQRESVPDINHMLLSVAPAITRCHYCRNGYGAKAPCLSETKTGVNHPRADDRR